MLSNFRKGGICSFFLKNHNYRFSNKIPGLLGSYLNVLTVLYSLKRADHTFDHSSLCQDFCNANRETVRQEYFYSLFFFL